MLLTLVPYQLCNFLFDDPKSFFETRRRKAQRERLFIYFYFSYSPVLPRRDEMIMFSSRKCALVTGEPNRLKTDYVAAAFVSALYSFYLFLLSSNLCPARSSFKDALSIKICCVARARKTRSSVSETK